MSFVSAGSPPLPEPSSATMVAGFPPPRIDECRQLPLRPALSSDAPSSAADTRSNRSDYDCVPAAGRIAAALTTLPKPEHPTASSAAALTSWLHDAVSAGQAVAGTSPDALAAVALPFGSAKAALTGARDDLPLHHHHHYQQQHHQHQHPLHMHQRQLGHLNNSNISNTNNQSQPRQHFAHRPLQPQSQSQSQPQSQLQSQQHLIVSSLHQTHPSYSSFRSPVPSVQQPEYAGTPQGHLSAFQSFAHPPPPPPGISSRCRMSVQFPTEAQTPPLASPDADFQSTCRDVDQGSMVRSDSAVLASASHGHLPRLSNQLLLGHSRTGAAASTTSLPPLDPSILALVPTSAAAAAAPTSSSPSSTTPSSHLAVQERHHHFAAAEQGVTATSGAHVDASAFAALRAEMSSGHAIRSQSGYSKATSPPPSLPPVPTSGLALASHASPTKMAQRQPYQQSFIRRTGRSPSPPRQIYAQQHSADVPQTPAIAPSMGPTPSPPNSFSGKHGRSSSLPPSSGHVPFQRSSSLPPIPVPAPRRPGPEPPTTSATAASTPVVPVAGARAAATPDVIAHVRALLSAPRASGPPQPVGGISGLTFEELIDSSTAPAEPSRAPETARELLMAGRRVSGVVTRPAIDDEHARRAEVQYPNSGNKAAVGGPNPSPMGSLATLPPPSASLCLRCATAVHHYAAGNPAHLAAFVVMVSGLCPACISTVLACEYVPRPLVAVTRRALVAGGCGLVHQDTLVVVPEDLFVRLEQHLSPRGMISAPEPGFSAQQQQFQLQHYQHQQRQHALYRHHYHYHGRGPRQDSGAAIDSPPVNPGPSSRAGATLGSFAGLAIAGTSNGGVSSNGSAIAMPFIGADLRQVAVSNNFVNKQYSAAALGGADEQCSFMSAAEQFALSPLSSPRFGLRSMLPSPIVVEPVTAQPTADVAVGSRALEHRPLSHGVHLALDSPAMSIDALASSLGQTASPDASMLSDMDVDDPEDDDNDGDALSLDFRLRPSIHKPPVAPDSWIARPPHPLAVDPIEAMPILGGCFSRLDAVKDRPRWVAGALRHRPRRLGGKESRVSASIERLHGALTTDISTDVPQYASAAAAAPRHRTVRRVALEGEPRPAVSASRWVPSSDGSLAAHSARSAAAPLPPPLSAASLPNLAPLLGAAAVPKITATDAAATIQARCAAEAAAASTSVHQGGGACPQ
ncbi:hypothetical protein BC828DRAFT_287289 [Blastocladiella britannica]|nr:hypothetical protein BC828DRAFT_287289 [Blastocladiella britannica]